MAAACQEEEETETLTPLTIPPRPQSFVEISTARALNSLQNNPNVLGVEDVEVRVEGTSGVELKSRGDKEPEEVGVSGKNGLDEEEEVQIDELHALLEGMLGNPKDAESLTGLGGADPTEREKAVTMAEADIIVLDDATSDEEEISRDERLVRRQMRHLKRMDEIAAEARVEHNAEKEDCPENREAHTGEDLDEHYASERKRKGNLEVQAADPEAHMVPFDKMSESEVSWTDDEEEVEMSNPQEEEGAFERLEILVTKRLLYDMARFEDPKQRAAYKGRQSGGKMVKSGRKPCLEDLKDLGVDEKFTNYFEQIGFQWLLSNFTEEVPVTLAREFFTTFMFKPTEDLDADSISFRLFSQEFLLSIREFSLRLGLFTTDEDAKGVWDERVSAHRRKQKDSTSMKLGR